MTNRFPLFVRAIFFAIGLAAAYLVMWQRPEFLNPDMMVATNIAMGGAALLSLNVAFWPRHETGLRHKLAFLSAFIFFIGATAIMGIGAGLVPFPSFPSFLFFTSVLAGLAILFVPNRHLEPCRA